MRTSLRFLLASAFLITSATACHIISPCTDCTTLEGVGGAGSTTGTGGACEGTTGRIVGHVDYSPDFMTSPVANALVGLAKAPGDTPTYGKADANGDYEIEIEAGTWFVFGEDDTGCYTDEPKQVTVEACGEVKVDLVLDLCTG